MSKVELPDVKPGDEIEVQLSPFGRFTNTDEEGKETVQLCDQAAFDGLVKNFTEPVLIDFDHKCEDGSDTEAAAWVESMRVDDKLGLMATFKMTDEGAAALAGLRYRFISPVWHTDEAGRPIKLLRAGLTNRPQIPVKPLINSVREHSPAGAVQPNSKKETPQMEELKKLLGLAAEASEADVIAAVTALKTKADEAEAKQKEAEAEAFANANAPDDAEKKEVLKNAYKQAPEVAKALVNAYGKKPADGGKLPEKPLINSQGKQPQLKPGAKSKDELRAEMASLAPSERAAFFKDHAAEM